VAPTINKSQVFEVVIAGIPLKLRSEKDPEVVKKLISYVDSKIQEALPATKSGSVQNAALLATLNLADEIFELKENALMQLEKMEKKTLKIIEDLESSKSAKAEAKGHA
jgi:cell division protein ZapA (FtsZ GTPase activity inhibitor)